MGLSLTLKGWAGGDRDDGAPAQNEANEAMNNERGLG